MVEAVIMMPLLLVLLIGEQWLLAQHWAALQVSARARTCAWVVATSGCETLPRECGARLNGSGSARALDDARDRLRAASWLTSAVLDIPILGTAVESILPRGVEATAGVTRDAPALFGGRQVDILGRLAVPCNELPHPESIFKDVLRAAAPTVF